MNSSNLWKCPTCNVFVLDNNKQEHIAGKRHRTNRANGLTPWTCDVCALTTILNNKDSHLSGAKHREAVQAGNPFTARYSWSDIARGAHFAQATNPSHAGEEKLEKDAESVASPPPPTGSTSWMMCSDCGLMIAVKDKDSHIAAHAATSNATKSSVWTCDICALTVLANQKDTHLAEPSHQFASRIKNVGATASNTTKSSVWTCDICALTVLANQKDTHLAKPSHQRASRIKNVRANGGDASAQLETAFQDATAAMASATAQRLLDLQTQLDAALCERDITKKELASAQKAWDEKEHMLLLKTDQLRAKIVSQDVYLDTTKAECTFERDLRVAAQLDLTARMREVEGLNTQLEEALDEKEKLTTALDRKVESIQTGRSILSLARTKLSDVTAARDVLLGQNATLTTTVDTLRKETVTQASQIQTLHQQLDLANQRWANHGQEITDEQLIWQDDEEVEAEKRQQEESIHQARERLDKMRRDELELKAKEEARRRKCAEEKRAREAEEEKKRRNEEEARRMAAEKEEKEKIQAYERWRNTTASEILRHQMISRTRFQAHNGLWTTAKALDRFLKLLGELPALAFSAQQPLTFWSVPWPILTNPLQLDPGRIDWEATETFFIDAKDILPAVEYKEMLLKAQRTFHPDRWVIKLRLILDDEARESLRKVINTVEQVVNSLLTPE